MKPPYLVLGNHGSVMDPFFVNSFVPAPIHYVVSDSNFRSRIVDFGLSLVGGIPKTKALSDLETVKNIIKIKSNRGIIGVFPEGQSTWDGHTLPIYYSTAKLVKSLKIPVVIAKSRGAFLSLPRWARSYRRGLITVSYEMGFTPEELKRSSVEDVYRKVVRLLDHDEFEHQQQFMVPFRGPNRAEHLEIVLFVCPNCHGISTLESEKHFLRCQRCKYTVRYTVYGEFEAHSGPRHFRTLREWNVWQTSYAEALLDRHLDQGSEDEIFADEQVIAQKGFKSSPLEKFHEGRLSLYTDRIVLRPRDGSPEIAFHHRLIEGINVQNSEHLEFYYEGELFRITIRSRRGNTYKWNLAVRHIQHRSREVSVVQEGT
jgi:1-acyl-sn-glycerol-3-phosphate acyltransferase